MVKKKRYTYLVFSEDEAGNRFLSAVTTSAVSALSLTLLEKARVVSIFRVALKVHGVGFFGDAELVYPFKK